MKVFRKITTYILILTFILANFYCISNAAINPPMPSPQMLRIEAKNVGEAPIGYIEGVGYYFDLKWDPLTMPVGEGSDSAYSNVYLNEIAKYNGGSSLILHDKDVSKSVNSLRISGLKSGTIYNVITKAYYTKTDGTTTFTSGESAASNTVKVLTDIQLVAYSYGPNQIKIEWDDVWDSGKRIDYKLYISQSKDFANTEPMFIKQAQIGTNGPVIPNTTTGKLEYIHNVKDSGAVYYVKIVPDIADPELKKNTESKTTAVSSYILANTTKMATTDSGTIWRISWTPVVTDLNSSDIDLSYKIYKGTIGSSNLPAYVATVVGNTNYFVTLGPKDNDSYYIIRASVTWKNTGADVYPVDILSDQIFIKEQEVSSTPPTPEIVNLFEKISNHPETTIISYDDVFDASGNLLKKGELTSKSATILLRVPKKSTGEIDSDTLYDMWKITDPNMIDTPTDNMKLPFSGKMGTDNEVKNGTDVVGYKYKLSDLTPNSTYYFKIIARKTFMEYVNGKLTSVTYYSQPALKVIITPTEGAIDQPVVPSRPPFKIKQSIDGKNVITSTTATIQLKNMWYEKLITSTGKWEYVRSEKLNSGDNPPYNPNDPATPPDNINYRKVEYDSGVTIDVGCVEFTTDGMDISTLPTTKVTGVPTTVPSSDYVDGKIYNPDQSETASLNVDGKRHNIDIQLTGLLPNTTYIVWVRADRSGGTSSGPSDPIIITTNPDSTPPIEKPTVPTFNYTQAGDSFADFGWVFKDGYKYNIKYGTVDDISSATNSVTVTLQDFSSNFYRIKGLTPNTLYYFWIQAETTVGSQTSDSEWSDSFPLKTLPYLPPNTPLGFGVKNSSDAITKNSITFEWLKEDGVQYILEVASDISYKNSKEYTAGTVSEFKVDSLKSNFRYYVRLYAFDATKNLRSDPTQSVTVRTLRSTDDYDSSQDVENVIQGDYIVKDTTVSNNTWNVRIVGVNADRFIEHIQSDKYLDYKIDLSEPPKKVVKINIQLSNKVFQALSNLKENITLVTGNDEYVIRWGMLFDKTGDFNYEIGVTTVDNPDKSNAENLLFKTDVTNVAINADDGSNQTPVTKLNNPLKVYVPYSGADWYKEGVTSAYEYNAGSTLWEKLKTSKTYDTNNNSGKLSFETQSLGDMVVADTGNNYFDDVHGNVYETAIANVSAVHQLNSIQGRNFEPDKVASISDVVKLIFDVYDYDYTGKDYMTEASRSGIISAPDIGNLDGKCSREKAIAMVVRLYEMKTKEKALATSTYKTSYTDMNSVSPAYLPKVKFADENGLIVNDSSQLAPKDNISKGEVVLMLEKLLAMLGEID